MQKYKAFTFLELIIVMTIMLILATISVTAYRSLVDSFSINEVTLSVAQDMRAIQRSSMLLDRDEEERWLHGIGIDFSNIENDGEYRVFKWCSEFEFFDSKETKLNSELPAFEAGIPATLTDSPIVDSCRRRNAYSVLSCEQGVLDEYSDSWAEECNNLRESCIANIDCEGEPPECYDDEVENCNDSYPSNCSLDILNPDLADDLRADRDNDLSLCLDEPIDARVITKTKRFPDYDNLDFELNGDVVYIIFESVSGKAFFYDEFGEILNYTFSGGNIVFNDRPDIRRFRLDISPWRPTSELPARTIVASPVSGRIYFEYEGENE